MANVQPENGYTKIANELLDKIQIYKFTTNQYKIILAVWRFTYGFNRKQHEISLSFLEKITHLTRTRINESLKDLIKNKVLIEVQRGGSNHKAKVLSFNKNYDQWNITKYASTSVQNDTSLPNDTSTGVQDDTRSSLRNDTHKRKDKENIKEKIPYVEIIKYLNEKAGKKFSSKSATNKKLISGRFAEGRTLEDFKHVIDLKCKQWLNNPDMNKYLRPETLFSQKHFENYVNEQYEQRPAKKQTDPRDKDFAFQRWIEDGNNPDEFDWGK